MAVPVLALVLSLFLLAGCGGGGGDAADGGTDVDQLLQDTFAGGKEISSGRIDASVDVKAEGNVAMKLSGPFQSTGEGKLPKLDLEASFEGEGQSVSGGVTSTGEEAFVGWGGTQYAIAGPVFEQFKAGYEESAKQATGKDDQSLASLGIDPRRWLTNARNAGEAKVGDADTIKITGDVDVPKLLDDVNRALERIRSLGVQGSGQLPDQLSDAERKQVADAINDLSVEIHTGADDRILRRILISMQVQGNQAESADLRLDLRLLDLNEDQDIEAPENAKPFEELVQKLQSLGLGDLGGLGALGGAAGGGGSSAPSEANVEEYSKCIQDAQGDNARIRKCADVLTTP
ncbi:MAG: hypothetical protein ACXW08_10950 [Solirubrobacteraceae bacterium]